MNTAQKKFKKVIKARKRREAYLRRKNIGGARTIDISKFVQSLPIPTAPKKQGFFSKVRQWKDRVTSNFKRG